MEHTRLYLIRHGQVQGFEQLRYNGHTDVPLTDVGEKQLLAAAEDLADVHLDAVYASDLRRARFGGEAIVRGRNMDLRIEPAFREILFGTWEGMTSEEVEASHPGALGARMADIADYRPPGGESFNDLWVRVNTRLAALLEEHKGQTVALVAHSGVNRVVLLNVLQAAPEAIWRLHQDFGCLNILDFYEDGFSMVRLANGPNRVQGM